MGEGGGARRSLGRCVSVDRIAKDFKLKGRLSNEMEAFSLVEDYLLFRFGSKEERDSILYGGP